MKILFLDDNEDRWIHFKNVVDYDVAQWAQTAKECIHWLQKEKYDQVCLDHDLGGEVFVDSDREDTGMEVVRWIVANKPQIDEIYVHTHNQPAGIRMATSLREAGYSVTYVPFGVML